MKNYVKGLPIVFLLLASIFVVDCCREIHKNPVQESNLSQSDTFYIKKITGTAADTLIARMYLEEAQALIDSALYDSALVLAQNAKNIFIKWLENDDLRIGDVYFNMGVSFLKKSILDSAEFYLRKSLTISENALGEIHRKVANIYLNIGSVYVIKGDFNEARKNYQKTLDIYLQEIDTLNSNLAFCFNNLGIINWNEGEYNKALFYFKKAMAIWINEYGSSHVYISNSHNNIGLINRNKGQLDQALESFEKALEIRLHNYKSNHRDIAATYVNIGLVYSDKGMLAESLQYFHKALEIQLPQNLPDVATTYTNIGRVYSFKGQFDRAIEYDKKALAIELKSFSPSHPNIAFSYHNLGWNYKENGLYERAIEHFQKAIEILSQTLPPDNVNFAFIYNSLALTYHDDKQFEKSFTYFQNALDISKQQLGNLHPLVSEVYHHLSKLSSEYSTLYTAIHYNDLAQQSLNYRDGVEFEEVLSLKNLIEVLSQRGIFEFQLFQKTGSLNYLRKAQKISQIALKALIQLNETFVEQSSRQNLISSAYPIFENAIASNFALSNATDSTVYLNTAFKNLEQSRAILIREAFSIAKAKNYLNLPDSLLEKENHLQYQITQIEKKRYEEQIGVEDESRKDSIFRYYTNQFFKLKRAYDTIQQQFIVNHPEYYKLKYDNYVIGINGIQDSLLNPHQSLLEYFIGDSTIFLFLVTKDTFHIAQLKQDFPLKQTAAQMRQGIYGHFTEGADETTCAYQFTEASHLLYQKIFAPVDSLLPDSSELIIVPDGELGYIPFDALLVERPERPMDYRTHSYLLKDHVISYAYSATLLKEMKEKQHNNKFKGNLLAFAPVFSIPDSVLAIHTLDTSNLRSGFGDLKYNVPEVKAIKEKIGGKLYLNEQATKLNFLEEASNFGILHLSTHGILNDQSGDYSFLAFYNSEGDPEKGFLYNSELYNLPLRADMVVLSACETGMGKLQRGEGIISLGRGFSYAGAKSIVTSLWKVDDAVSKTLMVDFYEYLKKGMTKDAALQQAKLDCLKSKNIEPFYWASMIAIGDMAPIELNSTPKWYIWLIMLGMFLMGMTLYFILQKNLKTHLKKSNEIQNQILHK